MLHANVLLCNSVGKRAVFDPRNKAHVASLKTFLETGSWGDILFLAEGNFVDVPSSVMMKYLHHVLKITPAVKQVL
jgi:hypothetical protein